MGGVAQTYGELAYNRDAWALGSDVSEDAARGHILVRHATQEDRANLSSGAASDAYNFLGVVAQVYGGEAAGSATEETVDTLDARVEAVWGRNLPVKIQDSATVAYLDPLTFSTTGAGALRTALAGEVVVAICKRAIVSGAVDQTTIADVLPPRGETVGGGLRLAKVALAASDAAAGLLAWQNTTGGAVFIDRLLVDITTPATGACTADFGDPATAILDDTLMDGIDVGAAAAEFDNNWNAGTNGEAKMVKVPAGGYVTGSVASGASAGLVGSAYIFYVRE